MNLKSFSVVIFLLSLLNFVNSAHILALFSSLSFTDHYVFRSYVSILARRGHNVVVMNPYPNLFLSPEKERIVELDVSEASAPLFEEYKKLITNTNDFYPRIKALNEFSLKLAIAQLKSQAMTALFVNPNIKFDLVITEADIPLLYAVADKYAAPHIAVTAGSGTIPMYESKGCPTHPLLYPHTHTLNYGDLSLWQKFSELLRYYHIRREYYDNYIPLSQVAAKKILGLKKSLLEVEQNIDLLLVAANPMLIGNRPTTPAVDYVDRLHIKPGIPLAKDLKAIMDSSEKGVIYFSLGAIQESEQLSPKNLKLLSEAFSELPYTVLWKIGNRTLIGDAGNIVTNPWFPQQELFLHPNLKAFITHGGLRSLDEAIYYGVPTIGFPTVTPRKVFLSEIVKQGAGELLDPYYTSKEDIKKTITTVVENNQKYKQEMIRLKALSQDALFSGPDHALWKTEYIIMHGGGKHLRSPSVGVNFLDYSMVNVSVYVLIISIIFAVVLYLVLRQIIKVVKERFLYKPAKDGKFKAL